MSVVRRTRVMLQEFVAEETASGVVLVGALATGLLWANAARGSYRDVWHRALGVEVGIVRIDLTLGGWVTHGLMTLFFFAVGLELKRELTRGELREPRAAALPMLAAVGGVIVPALTYVALMAGDPSVDAWGVPTATDLALVLGVLALLGSRAPTGLKVFMLTLAITDDLIGIVLIALFYSHDLSLGYLVSAVVAVAVIAAMRPFVAHVAVYGVVGVVLWYLVLRSGVEAPIAGAVLGALVPARLVRGRDLLEGLERAFVPLSAFFAIPLFALANVDLDLSPTALGDALSSRVAWAVVVARVAGKVVGISVVGLLVLHVGWGHLPAGLGRRHLVAGAALSGVGFAVAFFIAEAALAGTGAALEHARLGVLLAAIIAAAVASAILTLSPHRRREAAERGP